MEERPTSDQRLERGRTYLRLLRRVLLRVDRLGSALIEPHRLTNQQFLALLLIRDNAGLTQAELAAELDSDQNTVSALVRRLERRALVTREPHPSDRRALRLVVTPAGAALVSETQPDVDRLSRLLDAIAPLGDDATLLNWLGQIADIERVP